MVKLEKILKCHFNIPFIFGPEGEYNYTFEGKKYYIKIEHKPLTIMHTLVPNIGNLHEMYHGFSIIQLTMPKPFDQWSDKSTEVLYEDILGFLSEFQYNFLHVSGDYLWVSFMKEYIPTISIQDMEEGIMFIISQRDVWRRLPKRKKNLDVEALFNELIKGNTILNPEFIYLIDARKHYSIGEYHIMYVELAIILEIMNEKTIKRKKLKPVDGLSHQSTLLLIKCGWKEAKIKEIKQLCKSRNNMVHNRVKDFSPDDALKHLIIIEQAVTDMNQWLSNS